MRHLFHSDMSLKICVGLVFAFALNCVTVTGFHLSDLFGSYHSYYYDHVTSKIYNIHEKIGSSKGACVKHVTATGNGVGDDFHLPCSRVFTLTSDKILLYGNPEQDTFTLFSYSPSTLIVLEGNKCSERKYKTDNEILVTETSELNEDDCKQVRNKINYIIDQESKVLDMLATYFDNKASQSPAKYASSSGKSETEDSKHQNEVSDTQATYNKPSPTYQSGKYANEAKQQAARRGITVTEMSSSPPKLNPSLMDQPLQAAAPVAVSHQNGLTVTEQVSNPSNKAPEPQPAADATPNHAESAASDSSNSNFGRFRTTYDKLKEKVTNHIKAHH